MREERDEARNLIDTVDEEIEQVKQEKTEVEKRLSSFEGMFRITVQGKYCTVCLRNCVVYCGRYLLSVHWIKASCNRMSM